MQVPTSTYRIQLNDHFTLKNLRGIIEYLYQLGIGTIYASPITTAFKGSSHGYDVVDPLVLSPEIGTEEELREIAAILKERGMTWLQDIVPNHMAYDTKNPWLYDVLQNGEQSAYYAYFDIMAPAGEKLMAPFLGTSLEECLRKKEIRLNKDSIGFYDKEYPLAPGSLDAPPQPLEQLLQKQHYELTDFRLASERINYRRFFTVSSLICLRMEKEEVFQAYHKQILHWYHQDWIQGLRIDHIDGLAQPKEYTQHLKELFGEDCYIVAEKILTGEEHLPEDWPIEGTTGYDFLAMAGQLLTDTDGSRLLLDFYKEKIINLPEYTRLVFEKKYDFLSRYMRGELKHLLQLLTRDSLFTSEQDEERLGEALAVLMSSVPVYRAYPGDGPISEPDWLVINAAVQKAKHFRSDLRGEIGCLESFLKTPSTFRSRLMQFTGPLAAKGIEDTTFYVYNPYIALNEVGDSPGKAGLSADEFHKKMTYRQTHSPHTLNCTTTHDTKRGEDSRIRLSLLSSMPREWMEAVSRWRELNSPIQPPSPNDEYLIYQALLGGFPADTIVTDEFRGRVSDYLTKALREAKTETNYDTPNEEYEQNARNFVKALLQDGSPFLQDFTPFVRRIIHESITYSLSLLLLKLTCPGIPDIYQGAELWETSFVDPDNRRPVDYGHRAQLLQQIMVVESKGGDALREFLQAHREEGAEKLFLLYRTLNFRKEYPLLFSGGEYIPVPVKGPVLAYLRRQGRDWALVVVPLIRFGQPLPERLALSLPPGAPESWTHVFTGATHRAAIDLAGPQLENTLSEWPVALLSGRS
ncbi:MAG: malto-oligosyltrehalose synthase [Bacteroidetes bacterium]|nr:malto-oligosyltrehalose synthase [Bacteroidota bacterium]